jgi:hypothetical protein
MLLRRDGDDVIAIGQPAHAWLSGQLARAWADPLEPWEEVCLAAEQHDVGMAEWDVAPKLNPETGLPRSFMEVELDDHLEIWWRAAPRMIPQSRYAALLVSMHGTALYERRRPDAAGKVQAFLDGQRELQERLGAGFDPEQVRRNQRLVWTWDSLSLGLLLDWSPFVLEAVPTYGDIQVVDGTLDPWPFARSTISVRSEGRRLTGRFSDEQAMREALDRAPWVTIELDLCARS